MERYRVNTSFGIIKSGAYYDESKQCYGPFDSLAEAIKEAQELIRET
jgi:hypothetical protein